MRNRTAISLLEVLIGVILLVMGLIPTWSLFSVEERESAFLGQKMIVMTHLKEVTDLTQSRVYLDYFKTRAFEDGRIAELECGDGILKVKEKIQVWPANKVPGLYQIRVQAEWMDPTGKIKVPQELVALRLVADPEWRLRHHKPDSFLGATPGNSPRPSAAPPGFPKDGIKTREK